MTWLLTQWHRLCTRWTNYKAAQRKKSAEWEGSEENDKWKDQQW